jgi:hypothetical protein
MSSSETKKNHHGLTKMSWCLVMDISQENKETRLASDTPLVSAFHAFKESSKPFVSPANLQRKFHSVWNKGFSPKNVCHGAQEMTYEKV